MTKIAKTLLSLTLGLALFGTSAQAKQTLRWSEPSEIQTLDPALSVDTTSSEMMRNSYEGLYRFENNGQVKKALVKKETRSADGLTYTFTLQKNAFTVGNEPSILILKLQMPNSLTVSKMLLPSWLVKKPPLNWG